MRNCLSFKKIKLKKKKRQKKLSHKIVHSLKIWLKPKDNKLKIFYHLKNNLQCIKKN